jgi:trimeric autotransporter adhesin
VALSGDGSTLAVGAYFEDGNSNLVTDSGAVYVFTLSGSTWSQQAYIKEGAQAYYNFGWSVALAADGGTLAVGAHHANSQRGAVTVFTGSGSTWNLQATLSASNGWAQDFFGQSVALSADGSTLAVGADGEESNATGIDGDPTNNSAQDSGAVYVFTRSGSTWSQQAYVKASNTGALDHFGVSVALSADGSTLAVGAYGEDSSAIGIDGNGADNSAADSGAVYVFTRSGSTWSQQAYVKASNTGADDWFGISAALSADGGILAAGAYREDSSGAVYLY